MLMQLCVNVQQVEAPPQLATANYSPPSTRSDGRTGKAPYLHGDGVSDVSRQEGEHLHEAAQQAHSVSAGVDLLVRVLVAEGVDDVDHDGRRVRDGVGLSVCRLAHFVPLHCAAWTEKQKRYLN